MKPTHTLVLLAASLLAAGAAAAQTTPPPKPADNEATATGVVVLCPFEVGSKKDTSYGATNSLTATRTARPINETPLAIRVLTAEFLKDTGASSSFTDAFRYVPSVVPDNRSEGEGQNISGSVIGYARGFPLTGVLRNGVSRNGAFSLRNLERVGFLKGPVSVFFGAAEPGGTVNYITAWSAEFMGAFRFGQMAKVMI